MGLQGLRISSLFVLLSIIFLFACNGGPVQINIHDAETFAAADIDSMTTDTNTGAENGVSDSFTKDDYAMPDNDASTNPCLGEGEYGKDDPSSPVYCCSDLKQIPCDDLDASAGQCVKCTGAFYCTYCWDGKCGKGENLCNCPIDCK